MYNQRIPRETVDKFCRHLAEMHVGDTPMSAEVFRRLPRDYVDQICREVAAMHAMRAVGVLESFTTGAVEVQCIDADGATRTLPIISGRVEATA